HRGRPPRAAALLRRLGLAAPRRARRRRAHRSRGTQDPLAAAREEAGRGEAAPVSAATLLGALAEASAAIAVLSAVAAVVTRRTRPGDAAGAHRVWLAVVGLALPLVLLELAAPPILVVVAPRAPLGAFD